MDDYTRYTIVDNHNGSGGFVSFESVTLDENDNMVSGGRVEFATETKTVYPPVDGCGVYSMSEAMATFIECGITPRGWFGEINYQD